MSGRSALCLIALMLMAFSPLTACSIENELTSLPKYSCILSGPVWLHFSGLNLEVKAPLAQQYAYQKDFVPIKPTTYFSRDKLVTVDIGDRPLQNSPSIAVNPKDPDNVVIACQDYDVKGCIVVYTSFDGGVTWKGPIPLHILPHDEQGSDPVVAFDRRGNVYVAYMSVGVKPIEFNETTVYAYSSDIVVAKSRDGGVTWSEPVIAAKGRGYLDPNLGYVFLFLDKPWIAIGPDPEKPSRDVIYVSYTELAEIHPLEGSPYLLTTIKVVRSTDAGRSFEEPVTVSPSRESPVEISNPEQAVIVQGSCVAVDNNGTVYVAYYDSGDDGWLSGTFNVMIARSVNGGVNFTEPTKIAEARELDYVLQPTRFRAWSSMFPMIAVGPEGNVYAVFAVNPEGPDDSDIVFTRSTDGGRTWSELIEVNDDRTENDQFFPCIAVDPNGVIHVIFGDRRDDPSDVCYNVYYTNSSDGGKSFTPNQRVSDVSSNPLFGFSEGAYLGDYFGLAVSERDVYVAWTDCRAGSRYYANQDVMTARIRDFPKPEIEIVPSVCSIGDSVTVLGGNFSYLRDVSLEVDGVKVGEAKTDRNGKFNATLIVPVLSEGSHTIRAIDALGYYADVELRISFGFNTIGKEIDIVKDEISFVNRTLSSIGEQVQGLRKEIKGYVSEAEKGILEKVDKKAEELRSELNKGIGEVRGDVSGLKEYLSGRITSLEEEVERRIASVSNYLIAILVVTIAALAIAIITLIRVVRR